MDWRDYIYSDPEILMGEPVVKGTRLSVDFILRLFAKGWTEQQIFESYPTLTPEALWAIFAFAVETEREMLYEIKMRWPDIRKTYPDQWLVIEALEAHTEDGERILDRLMVIETCPDGAAAFQSYRRLHQEYPQREFYFVSTRRETLTIHERQWLGVRIRQEGMA